MIIDLIPVSGETKLGEMETWSGDFKKPNLHFLIESRMIESKNHQSRSNLRSILFGKIPEETAESKICF